MSVLVIFGLFLTLSQVVTEPNLDLCGKYAILNLMDEFHIGQTVEKIINVDLGNYEKLFENLATKVSDFKTNAEKYDTEDEINALEPDPLIKFSENLNFIKVSVSRTQDFNSRCRAKQAAMIPLEPFMIEEITKIMKETAILRTPVSILAIGEDLVSHTGSYFDTIREDQRTLIDNNFKKLTGMLLANGSVYFETDSTPETGLCQKSSNPWDIKGPIRSKFLTTIPKIIKVLPKIQEWAENFKIFNKKAKLNLGSLSAGPEKYQLALPSQLTNIQNFIGKYSRALTWEKTIPSSLNDFLGFIQCMRDLIPSFSEKRNENQSAPRMQIQTVDDARLVAHLGIPKHFSISGKLTIKPVSNHKLLENSIPVAISALVFNTLEKAYLYQVKPLIFERKMVDIQYVITWAGKALSFTSMPSVLKCQVESPDPAEKPVKVCSSFQQPGAAAMSINDRTKCALALLSTTTSENIKHCPVSLTQGSSVTASRAQCEGFSGEVAIISSHKPIKITVRCTETDARTLTYKMFPIKIQTGCELRLVEGKTEKLLLPAISSGLPVDEDIKNGGLLIVTPSSTLTEDELRDSDLERNLTLTKQLKEENLSHTELFVKYLPFLAAGLSGFTVFTVFISCICFCIGKEKAIIGFKKLWSCFKFMCKCCKCFKCKCCRKKEKTDNGYMVDIENIELGELSELLKARLAKNPANNQANAPNEESESLKSVNSDSKFSSRAQSPSNLSVKSASALQKGKRVSHTFR